MEEKKSSRKDVTTEIIYSAPVSPRLSLAKDHPILLREIQGVCLGMTNIWQLENNKYSAFR